MAEEHPQRATESEGTKLIFLDSMGTIPPIREEVLADISHCFI